MRRLINVIVLICLPIILFAQNQDTIFIWDNDRGDIRHFYPAVGATQNNAFIAWQDGRTLDYDIWRTWRNWLGTRLDTDREVSMDPGGNYWQTKVDCEGNPSTGVVFVWEDSLYKGTAPGPTRIMAAIHDGNPFQIFANTMSHKNPSVSCANNGQFVVSFTTWGTGVSAIRVSRHTATGNVQSQYTANTADSLRAWVPISRTAYCDSGYVVVYEDTTAANARSIFLHYCKRDGSIVSNRIKVTNPGNPTETFNESSPGVAVNASGFVVVVWQDDRNSSTSPDIYCRTYQMRPGSSTIVPGGEVSVSTYSDTDMRPRVAVFPSNDFVVVWQQYQGNIPFSYDIRGRINIASNFRTTMTLNTIDTLSQNQPDVECRNSDTFYVAWQSNPGNNIYDIYCRSFFKFTGTDWGIVGGFTPELLLSPDSIGGRKTWYFDNENYDNPATPGWNEDPIAEPESIYVDLDFAMVDQIMEINTNNQYFVFNEDTISRQGKGRALSYDAVFLDLGFRTGLATAGTITTGEQAILASYISPVSGTGKPAMVEGNDFGAMYSSTTLFSLFHAEYMGDGAPYTDGNIDTLYGTANTYGRGETLNYDYQSWADNYVDSLSPASYGRVILQSTGAMDRWSASRSIGFENSWKDRSRLQGNTVYNSFMLSGMKSGDHPHTYAEYFRRTMGFLGLSCQPEPITTLTSTTGASEGYVSISWKIVSDDSLTEPANGGYQLKFARLKMGSETAYEDSSEEYYQQWSATGAVGTTVNRSLYGLPPMDTLIFALKVKDETGLWDALGDEPRAVVQGDSLTPHTVVVGDNFVKDFANLWELFDVRLSDSLFMSWDQNNFFLGFARCKFKTAGDLFVYLDTKSGGADSTVGWSASTGKSAFGVAFRPDYVFIFDDSTNYKMQKYSPAKDGRGVWVDTAFSGRLGADSIVNKYYYTEISVPFLNMRYDTMAGFKVQVLVQNEASNYIWNAYPPNNPVGGTGLYLPYYYFAANGLRSNLVPNHGLVYIGVEEDEGQSSLALYLSITPNPFRQRTDIRFSIHDSGITDKKRSLMIYDISGRLVRDLSVALKSCIMDHASAISWNGTDQAGRNVSPGVYFCALKAGDRTEIVKAVYVR